ncbi:hypothetical protein FHS55_003632 [Angulomicrobium tetraedrale]|uniref:Thioesterase domain-containing protein n=1 Tax=Ancylobacter tetraedralis TaxID=217068 RepID=A0A839ZEC1_9HYPH|nr:alpha/beta hydrolase [Ancylobacter tetraedralis]MBB3773007.1 hypothetical protein [Ancylobacter tetraedralis]
MKLSRRAFALALLIAAAGLASPVEAQQSLTRPPWASAPPTAKGNAPLPTRADTHVYLLRGLFGVFSLGLDKLAQELVARGYTAEIQNWDDAETVIQQVTARASGGHTGPVVLIGHSLGANAVIEVATAVSARGVPIVLGVTFDATEPGPVPDNVAVFINFWAKDGFGRPVQAVPGYGGQLENFDLSEVPDISHTSIDTMDRFHQFVITTLDSMTRH